MTTAGDNPAAADPGLIVLVTLLRFNGVGADAEQIRHRLGGIPVGVSEMVRVAKDLGLKARVHSTRWSRLASSPLPAIAVLRDGSYLFLGKVGENDALVQHPLSSRPSLMPRAEFEAIWDGRIVLMTRRSGLLDRSSRVAITW